ncbi:MAG: putative Redoxin domain protein [Nitrospira sp.]
MSRITAAILGLVIGLAEPAGFGVGTGVPAADAASSVAPAFELVTLSGEAYSHASLRGKPALLVFWAPWCKVCQRELPALASFYERDRPSALQVVSIGFADTRSNVEAFVKERAATFVFPTAYDEDRWTAQVFKVNATPTYVLLDARGDIVLVHRGGGILQNPQFREFLSTLKG